jgi:hypothetical protein
MPHSKNIRDYPDIMFDLFERALELGGITVTRENPGQVHTLKMRLHAFIRALEHSPEQVHANAARRFRNLALQKYGNELRLVPKRITAEYTSIAAALRNTPSPTPTSTQVHSTSPTPNDPNLDPSVSDILDD